MILIIFFRLFGKYDIINVEVKSERKRTCFLEKKQAHLLDPVVENLDSLKSLTVTPLPLYNWDTQEPQSFALSMTENNGDYHIKGSIVEQSRFRPTNGLTNDDRSSIVHHPLQIDQIRTYEVATLFEGTITNGKITNFTSNQDPRIPESLNKTLVDYAIGNMSEYDYQDTLFRTFASSNFEAEPAKHYQMAITKDQLEDLEDGQAFYSIRKNGQLFEVVELDPDDRLFGRYDLDARQSGTIVKAYTAYEDAIDDLQTRIKPEHQKLDVLSKDDLMALVDDARTL